MKKFICEFGSKYFTCDCITVIQNANAKDVSTTPSVSSSRADGAAVPSNHRSTASGVSATLSGEDRFKSGLKRTPGVKDLLDLVKE